MTKYFQLLFLNNQRKWTAAFLLSFTAAILLPVLTVEVMKAANAKHSVMQVSYYKPTETKAQSKVWYAHGSWWAWLPHRNGSVVWRRRDSNWEQLRHLNAALFRIDGVADVFQEGEQVGVIVAGARGLSFVRLAFDTDADTYRLDGEIINWTFGQRRLRHKVPHIGRILASRSGSYFREIENAVVVKGPAGTWWVTYDFDSQIMLLRSRTEEGVEWHQPELVATVENPDELSSIFVEDDGISVVWSDQHDDTIYHRQYTSEAPQPYHALGPKQIIASGGETADDHINIAQSDDGTIWIASKSDRDILSYAELTLRKRSPMQEWQNLDYEPFTLEHLPSRPIVMSIEGSSNIVLLHTMRERHRRKRNHIRIGQLDDQTHPGHVNYKQVGSEIFDQGNLTGSKAALPQDAEWIVLSSDRFGSVFEWVISEYVEE